MLIRVDKSHNGSWVDLFLDLAGNGLVRCQSGSSPVGGKRVDVSGFILPHAKNVGKELGLADVR